MFYQKIEFVFELLFCSGDHSRPFSTSKTNFRYQKLKVVWILTKKHFDRQIDFLIEKSISGLKKKRKKNIEKIKNNSKKPGKPKK